MEPSRDLSILIRATEYVDGIIPHSSPIGKNFSLPSRDIQTRSPKRKQAVSRIVKQEIQKFLRKFGLEVFPP